LSDLLLGVADVGGVLVLARALLGGGDGGLGGGLLGLHHRGAGGQRRGHVRLLVGDRARHLGAHGIGGAGRLDTRGARGAAVRPLHAREPGSALGVGAHLRRRHPPRPHRHLVRPVEALLGRHCWHEVAAVARLEDLLAHLLDAHVGHALHVLRRQVRLAVFLPLSQGNVQGLLDQDPAVHLRHGLGGLLGGREAHEAEALGAALLQHHLGAGDGAVGRELLPEALVVDGVVQVLDVQVDALVAVEALHLEQVEPALQLHLSLDLLLRPADVQGLALHELLAVEHFHGMLGAFGVLKSDEAKAPRLAVILAHHLAAGDLAVLLEHLPQFFFVEVLTEVLHVHVGIQLGLFSQFLFAFLPGNEPSNEYLRLKKKLFVLHNIAKTFLT